MTCCLYLPCCLLKVTFQTVLLKLINLIFEKVFANIIDIIVLKYFVLGAGLLWIVKERCLVLKESHH